MGTKRLAERQLQRLWKIDIEQDCDRQVVAPYRKNREIWEELGIARTTYMEWRNEIAYFHIPGFREAALQTQGKHYATDLEYWALLYIKAIVLAFQAKKKRPLRKKIVEFLEQNPFNYEEIMQRGTTTFRTQGSLGTG